MLSRLKILTILQLSNIAEVKRTKRLSAKIAVRILRIILITIVMALVVYLFNNFLYITVNIYFVIVMILLSQIFSIGGITSQLMNSLYESKENLILMSFPVTDNDIFISKLIVSYLRELLKSFNFIVPLLIGVGIIKNMGFSYYLGVVFLTLTLPLLATVISALISIPLTFFKNLFKRYSFLPVILGTIFFVLLYLLVSYGLSFLPEQIRIIQLYHSFTNNLYDTMMAISNYATIYKVAGFILYGQNLSLWYPVFLITPILLFMIVYVLIKPLYFRLASLTFEEARSKKRKAQNEKSNNLFVVFFKKELIVSLRSFGETLGHYSLLTMMPFIMLIINSIYMRMNRSLNGNTYVLVFNIIITLLIATASNTASATAISGEGSEFVLLKTAPSDTKTIAWAKILFNILISTTLIFISFVVFRVTLPKFPVLDLWLIFLLVIMINISHIFWSFELDILNPQLNQALALGTLNNSPNISKSIGIGFTLSFLAGFIALIGNMILGPYAWIILFGLAVLLLVIRFVYFRSYLSAYFIDIEM